MYYAIKDKRVILTCNAEMDSEDLSKQGAIQVRSDDPHDVGDYYDEVQGWVEGL